MWWRGRRLVRDSPGAGGVGTFADGFPGVGTFPGGNGACAAPGSGSGLFGGGGGGGEFGGNSNTPHMVLLSLGYWEVGSRKCAPGNSRRPRR